MQQADDARPPVGPQVIWSVDEAGLCTLSMGPGLEYLGLQPNELVGRDLFEVYAADHEGVAALTRVLAGETFSTEREFGGRILALSWLPMRDDGGRVTGALGVSTDVTEQRRTEDELHASRARAARLLELSKSLSRAVQDPDEVARGVVRAITETFAETGALWLRSADGERFEPQAVWRTDGGTAAPDPALCERVPLRTRGVQLGFVDVCLDPERGALSVAEKALADEIADRCALALDISLLLSAHREAHEQMVKFQALADASTDLIAIADQQQRFVYANPQIREFGVEVFEEDIWRTVATHAGEDLVTEIRSGLAAEGRWSREVDATVAGARLVVHLDVFDLHHPDTGTDMGTAWIARDITERLAAEHALRGLAEQRQALLARLVDAQDDERARIAADVHDDPVQALAAVDLRLGLLRRRLGVHAPDLLPDIEPLQASVTGATDRLRSLLFDLEPPDLERGLGPALKRAAQEIFDHTDVRWSVDADLEPDLPDSTRAIAYRIAKEAMINAHKHAGASTVEVSLAPRDGGVDVRVADDGVGLPADAPPSPRGHRGIATMQDRAAAAGGACTLRTRPEGGTTVTIWLPGPATGLRRDREMAPMH